MRRARWTVAAIALAIGATFVLDPYRDYLLTLVAAYLCATAGLGLLVGRTGQLSLGHAALMAAGGYGYALTVGNLQDVPALVQPLLGLVAAVLAAAGVGLLLGLAGARLHGPYLAGLTLAVVMALPALTSRVPGLGADRGLAVPYQAPPDGLAVGLEQWQAWTGIVVAALVVTTLAVVDRGPAGVRMRAVRDDETAAALAGVSPGRTKVLAFVLSAAAAGAGGGILCYVNAGVAPGGYTVSLSLLLLVGVVIGGTGRLGGAAVGAALVVLLPWVIGLLIELATDSLALPADLAQRLEGNLAVLLFGLLLIGLTAVAPGGVVGALTRTARKD